MSFPRTHPARPKTKDCGCSQTPGPKDCGCNETPGTPLPDVGECCPVPGFERPNYFRGHLLTDADLALDQRYDREKRRLYHRTLHGTGVVCGLKLSCHPHCPGYLLVCEGFAIDPCGNDLVACHPLTMNVLEVIFEKKWLSVKPKHAHEDPEDPGPLPSPDRPPDDCGSTQCFYVVARYTEEASRYVTPLGPGCRTDADPCRPTRITEGIELDLLRELPRCRTVFGALLEEFQEVARWVPALSQDDKDRIRTIDAGNAGTTQADYDADKALYDRLYQLLFTTVARHASKFDCSPCDPPQVPPFPLLTDYQLSATDAASATTSGSPAAAAVAGTAATTATAVTATVISPTYKSKVKAAFAGLLKLYDHAYRAAADAIVAYLAFPCPSPRGDENFVVLGRVEVVGDRLVRVCNTPRRYVWSFARLPQLLAATFLQPDVFSGRPAGACCSPTPWTSWNQAIGAAERVTDPAHRFDVELVSELEEILYCPSTPADVADWLGSLFARTQRPPSPSTPPPPPVSPPPPPPSPPIL